MPSLKKCIVTLLELWSSVEDKTLFCQVFKAFCLLLFLFIQDAPCKSSCNPNFAELSLSSIIKKKMTVCLCMYIVYPLRSYKRLGTFSKMFREVIHLCVGTSKSKSFSTN